MPRPGGSGTGGSALRAIADALATGGHGKLVLTRPVRYLADNLRMLGDQEGGVTASFAERYALMVERARGDGISAILELRRSAEAAGIAPEATAALSAAADSLARVVSTLDTSVPDETLSVALAGDIERELDVVTDALLAIREAAMREI